MYQKQISQLIGEISSLAVEVTMSGKAIVFCRVEGHVSWLDLKICDKNDYKKVLFEKNMVYFDGFHIEEEKKQKEALQTFQEMKFKLQQFLNVNPFHSIWETYQPSIEKEIIEEMKNGRTFNSEQLFHDVMLETTSREMSLDCVYQALKLSNSEGYAKLFKSEMLDNIEWLSNLINANWSDYEREEIA